MKATSKQIKQAMTEVHAIFAKLGFRWAYGNGGASTIKEFATRHGLTYIGVGCTRAVVAHPAAPGVVFKIVTKDWYGATDVTEVNKGEKAMWDQIKKTSLRKYFAPVRAISEDGYVLCMDYVQGVRVRNMDELEGQARVKDWQATSDKILREFYNIERQAWSRYQITLRDLHNENVMVALTPKGRSYRLKAVDYGGATYN